MTCTTCNRPVTPFSNRDCGRHKPSRPATSPWVQRASNGTLPSKDLTRKF